MRPFRTLAIATAAVALTMTGSAAALAATPALPDGSQLVTVTCFEDLPATLLAISSLDAATSSLASTDGTYECGYGAAWDSATGVLYAFINDDTTTLLRWDEVAGVLATVGEITDPLDNVVDLDSMAIDLEGNAFGMSGDTLYSLDLATGAATSVGILGGLADNAYGFSVDPVSGDLYALSENGHLYTVDTATPSLTEVATWTFTAGQSWSWGLAIDGNGIAWVNQSTGGSDTLLSSVPLADFGAEPDVAGDVVFNGDYASWWLAYVPAHAVAPTLANTGVDALSPLVGGAVAVLFGAGILAWGARRRVA